MKLIIACNMLIKVEDTFGINKRTQLDMSRISLIENYLSKVVNQCQHIDPIFSRYLYQFSNIIATLRKIVDETKIESLPNKIKEDLSNKLIVAINGFKTSVAKYLTKNEFDYKNGMDTVLVDIINTSINNGYYFE